MNNDEKCLQRAREEQTRRGNVVLRQKLKRNDDEDVITELEQRLKMVNGNGVARSTKKTKSKFDSSQINDGDFEKIMNGKLLSAEAAKKISESFMSDEYFYTRVNMIKILVNFFFHF